MSATSTFTANLQSLGRAGVRLERHLAALLTAVREGLGRPEVVPVQSARWQRAVALLEQDRREVSAGLDVLEQSGTADALIGHADRLRFLARQMDGYDTGFAGEALAERIATERRLAVMVASQIVLAAAGSPASGL